MAVQRCCCFSLKTGSLIIATLGWIFTLVKIFGLIGVASSPSQQKYDTDINDIDNHDVAAATLGYRIGYAVVSLIACVSLVYGIYKNSPNYFIPWLVVACLECIAISILALVCFIFIFVATYPASVVLGIMCVVFVLAGALNWYFWAVVLSYHKELKINPTGHPAGSNIYYSPSSPNPPPYAKDLQQIA